MAVFRQVPGPVQIVVVIHAAGELLAREAAVGQEDFVIVDGPQVRPALLGQLGLVETDPVPGRIDVQLADGVGLVPGIAERLGQAGQMMGPRGDGAEDSVAVGARLRAGHQCPAGGDADRALRVGARVADAVARELIERRRLDDRVPGAPEQPPRPLVGGHEQDIRPLFRWGNHYVILPRAAIETRPPIVVSNAGGAPPIERGLRTGRDA